MKKTILAVAIAAASYNVSASVASNNIHSLPSDAEKATAFNKMMEANGNDARILVGDGVATVTFTDGQGNKITKDITAADMPEVTERMAKVRVAAEQVIRDNMPSVNPPADGDLPPVSDIDPLPQLPSDAEKATAFNKMMEANGNDARILVGDGVATVTFTDGQGNKITKDITAADMPEVTERMAKVRIAAEQVIRDNMPSVNPPADGDLPPVSDIDPLPQLPSDAEKATAFNKMMEANGNDARILVGDGVATVTFTDGQGNKITKDITAADMPEVTERMAKVRIAAEQVIRDNMPSVSPPADGDLPPVSDIDPLPQLPSDAEKATAFNKMMEANGNDARILVGDGVATVTFTDGQGNKITKDITAADMPEVTERMAKVRVAAEQVIRDNMPSVNPPADGDLPPVSDIDPLPQLPSDAEKATAFNKMMEANGNDARILVGDGVATVTFTDGQGNKITKDITAADMPEVTERMAKVRVAAEQVIRDNMPSVNPPADGDLPPVSDIDPLPQLPSDAEKATAFNKMMEANGNDARILVGDGVATVTFTDGQGNKITKDITAADMPEVTERMAKVRVAAEQVIRDNMPSVNPPADGDLPPVEDVIVDPIEGDKPAPSEGQKIVEGLKKAADGIRDADKDWGENSTGAIAQYSQSVQAQTQSQIDELYALGNQNATDINTLFNEVDRLDSKIDGVAAMSQASLAARPYLSSNQTSSVGVGIGGAGSEAAFALGYAHRMTENWTANANVAINTGDNAEASYGAGVSYAW